MPRQNARSFVGLCASLLVMGALVFVAMSSSAAQGPCRGNWAEGNTYNVGDSVMYNITTISTLISHNTNENHDCPRQNANKSKTGAKYATTSDNKNHNSLPE